MVNLRCSKCGRSEFFAGKAKDEVVKNNWEFDGKYYICDKCLNTKKVEEKKDYEKERQKKDFFTD